MLQCGRNFCVAEIPHTDTKCQSGPIASMWPQLLRCGNIDHVLLTADMPLQLQCGRNFCVAEIRRSRGKEGGGYACFNVAATFALRKLR